MSAKYTMIIDPDGTVRCLYDDGTAPLTDALGKQVIRRASHVEPVLHLKGWQADMKPSNGPVLGPFPTRGEALAAEAAWLLEHGLPGPKAP